MGENGLEKEPIHYCTMCISHPVRVVGVDYRDLPYDCYYTKNIRCSTPSCRREYEEDQKVT